MPVPSVDPRPDRSHIGFMEALKRGFRRRCPACGAGRLFAGYLTMSERCNACGIDFEPCRADDAPAYFTILLVGHIIVPGILITEQLYQPAVWLQLAAWLPLTLLATLGMLPYIKGATIGAVWRSRC
jgi:uncharacterized protein (DUF983 family)